MHTKEFKQNGEIQTKSEVLHSPDTSPQRHVILASFTQME